MDVDFSRLFQTSEPVENLPIPEGVVFDGLVNMADEFLNAAQSCGVIESYSEILGDVSRVGRSVGFKIKGKSEALDSDSRLEVLDFRTSIFYPLDSREACSLRTRSSLLKGRDVESQIGDIETQDTLLAKDISRAFVNQARNLQLIQQEMQSNFSLQERQFASPLKLVSGS